MTFKEAAYFILKREKRPMTAKEIVEMALKEKLIKTSSKSPDRDMAIQIYDDIRLNGKNSPFVKVGRGLFGLREFDEQERETTAERVGHLIKRLEETQYRSNSPSEFEEVLKEAFSFLGFETDLIATPGNTDVVLKANIGRESYTVNVDGKTSKSGKISDVQIDWLSLEDHKGKTGADFVVVVGPDFAKGNVEKRAHKSGVVLLKVKDLIELLKEHDRYPFNLLELKRLFETPGDVSQVVEELVNAHRRRTHFLKNLKFIVEEMENLQSWLGYFTVDSLVARMVEKKLGPQMIKSVIDLLNSPLIKAVEEVSEGKYILVFSEKEISRVFERVASPFVEEAKGLNGKTSKDDKLKEKLIVYLSQDHRVPTLLREVLFPLCLEHTVVTREMIKEKLVRKRMAKDIRQAGLVLATASKVIGENELLKTIIEYDKVKPWMKDNFRLKKDYREIVQSVLEELGEIKENTQQKASVYFKWEMTKKSVIAWARKEKPYRNFCPLEYFQTILRKTLEAFRENTEVSVRTVASLLEKEELAPGRPFHGRSERYKIDMALGILELEGFIEWTGRKMPVTYRLKKPVEEIEKWAAWRFGV
ncbi:HTH domain-containing protein [Thermotoga sp.]|uniref:winged helix-turn-helix domain-containing protein n=1 Tax=Thermotoga sp. TaxID=28240 RepID=UPI0025D663C4|nr:HTH domain-containing protein [Thermotoga sp.]MCD6551384.1 winged helix-turn-helix domain-containing protein [Thermotoga sp.]